MDFCGSCGVPLRLGDAKDQCVLCKEESIGPNLIPLNVYAGCYDELTSLDTWRQGAVRIADEVAEGMVESQDECDSKGDKKGMTIFAEKPDIAAIIEALQGNDLKVGED